jgi:molybdate transport system permease protein
MRQGESVRCVEHPLDSLSMRCVPRLLELVLLTCAALLAGCGDGGPKLLAASSLTGVARSWDAEWREQEGAGIVRVHAASSDLVRMVESGAVGDVIVTANSEQMDRLEDSQLLWPDSRIDLASNGLCLVAPFDAPDPELAGMELLRASSGRVSLANPKAVPLGIYAKSWLKHLGAFESLQGRIVEATDARGALAAVESGRVSFGVVYATDARRSKRVRILCTAEAGEFDPILYPVAILAATPNVRRARDLLGLLVGERGGAALERAGFLALQESGGVSDDPYSDDEYVEEDAGPGLLSALWISLSVAAAAVLLDLIPALVLAWALARKRFFGRACVEAIATLPLILPPTAIGWLLLRSLSTDGPFAGLELLLTWPGAVIAAAVMSFPLILRSARTAFEEIDPRMEKMGSTLGLSRARVWWTITLPLARRGILAGLLLGFGRALGEFGATILVAGNIPGRTQTLSLAIFDRYQEQRDGEAMTLVGVSALLAFGLVLVVERLSRPAHSRVGPHA